MNQFRRSLHLIALPILTLLLGWQLGMEYAQQSLTHTTPTVTQTASGAMVQTDPQKEVDISLLWTVWKLLMVKYVHPDQLTTQTMVYGAVRGMVASLGDPYTLFMTPKENNDFHDLLDGHLEGIGAQLSLKDTEVVVMSDIKGSPAEKAGLQTNDVIVTVDGKALTAMTLDQIVGLIRGNKGTSVVLGVKRPGESALRTFTIVRDTIQVPSTEYEVKKSGKDSIGVLTINEFGGDTIQEIQNTLQTVNEKNLKGLVIDLRYNGGGYLDGAVDLSSMFLKDGKVVTVAGRDNHNEVHNVTGNPILPNIPIVVLINEGSASASEIFAGALKDHNRAELIGVQSFGKGTVQEVLDLQDGSSLRVTIARWLTPNGTDIGKVGITPNIIVADPTADDVKATRDNQMTAALEFLSTGKVTSVKTGTGTTK
jgi:carboxyl-terminal processing protease